MLFKKRIMTFELPQIHHCVRINRKKMGGEYITPPLQGYYVVFLSNSGCRKQTGSKFCADPQKGLYSAHLWAHTFEPEFCRT